MARTVAKLLTAVWQDDEWRALTAAAQRAYWLLLTQPKLSLAGCLDLMPQRWAGLACDDTTDDLRDALAELERARYVVIDAGTEEIVVRSFPKNDTAAGTVNGNIVKGFWTAWAGIQSHHLRAVVVANTPALLFDRDPEVVPSSAVDLRRSPPLEPPVLTDGSDLPPPSPPPSTTTTPGPDGPLEVEARRRMMLAIEAGTSVTSEDAYVRSIVKKLTREGWKPNTRPQPKAAVLNLPPDDEVVPPPANLRRLRAVGEQA